MGRKRLRIKVIHKENGGAGDTRDFEVSHLTGKFIGFIGSDNVISTNHFKFPYDNLVKYDADISCCDYFEFFTN